MKTSKNKKIFCLLKKPDLNVPLFLSISPSANLNQHNLDTRFNISIANWGFLKTHIASIKQWNVSFLYHVTRAPWTPKIQKQQLREKHLSIHNQSCIPRRFLTQRPQQKTRRSRSLRFIWNDSKIYIRRRHSRILHSTLEWCTSHRKDEEGRVKVRKINSHNEHHA